MRVLGLLGAVLAPAPASVTTRAPDPYTAPARLIARAAGLILPLVSAEGPDQPQRAAIVAELALLPGEVRERLPDLIDLGEARVDGELAAIALPIEMATDAAIEILVRLPAEHCLDSRTDTLVKLRQPQGLGHVGVLVVSSGVIAVLSARLAWLRAEARRLAA